MKKYNGLRKKPTFDELIHYLNYEQPRIKYPNRDAYFLSQSPEMLQFIGGGGMDDDIQSRLEHEQSKEKLIRDYARREGVSMAEARAMRPRSDYYELTPLLGPSAEDAARQRDETEERIKMLELYDSPPASSIRSESKRSESIAGSLPSLEDASPAPTLTQEILEKKEEERKHSKKKDESRESAETEERETQRKPSKESEASVKSIGLRDFAHLTFSEKIKYLEKKGVDAIAQLRVKFPELDNYSNDELKNMDPKNVMFGVQTLFTSELLRIEGQRPGPRTEEEKKEEKIKKKEEEQKEQKEADRIGILYNKTLFEEINALGGNISSKAKKEELVAYLLTLKNIKATPTIIGHTSSRSRSQQRTRATGSSASQKRDRSQQPGGGGLGRSSNLPSIPK
jgi:hypothetical protein